MALADPGQPSRDTGLPPGVEVGPLGKRAVAYLIEVLVPAVVGIVLFAMLPGASGTVRASSASWARWWSSAGRC
jgi:hypothetical protein